MSASTTFHNATAEISLVIVELETLAKALSMTGNPILSDKLVGITGRLDLARNEMNDCYDQMLSDGLKQARSITGPLTEAVLQGKIGPQRVLTPYQT